MIDRKWLNIETNPFLLPSEDKNSKEKMLKTSQNWLRKPSGSGSKLNCNNDNISAFSAVFKRNQFSLPTDSICVNNSRFPPTAEKNAFPKASTWLDLA